MCEFSLKIPTLLLAPVDTCGPPTPTLPPPPPLPPPPFRPGSPAAQVPLTPRGVQSPRARTPGALRARLRARVASPRGRRQGRRSWEMRPPPNHPERASPLFIHSFIHEHSFHFRCSPSSEPQSGPHWAGALSSPQGPRDAEIRHHLASAAWDLPSAVPPSPEQPGAQRHLPSPRPSLPPKAAAFMDGEEEPPPRAVLASGVALCQVPAPREAPLPPPLTPLPPPRQQEGSGRGPDARGLRVRVSHTRRLQGGQQPRQGGAAPASPPGFSAGRAGPVLPTARRNYKSQQRGGPDFRKPRLGGEEAAETWRRSRGFM